MFILTYLPCAETKFQSSLAGNGESTTFIEALEQSELISNFTVTRARVLDTRGLLVPLSLEEPPDWHVIRMKLLPQVSPVFRDIDKHDGAHRGLDGFMGLRNDCWRPRAT